VNPGSRAKTSSIPVGGGKSENASRKLATHSLRVLGGEGVGLQLRLGSGPTGLIFHLRDLFDVADGGARVSRWQSAGEFDSS
jgi:hypothetical protein